MSDLPVLIDPGDLDHILHHETSHGLLDPIAELPGFGISGWDQGVAADRPAAAVGNRGMFYFSTDVPALDYSDGTAWHRQVLTTGSQTFTGINTFDEDVFFGSGVPWIDVRAKGAAGDNVADDTTAIQDAHDDMATRAEFSATMGKSVVYFSEPPVNYRTTAPIDVDHSMVELVGASMGVLIKNVTNGSDVVRFNEAGVAAGSYGSGIRNLSLQGTGTTSRAIYANFVQHLTVQRVNCINHPGPALYMESTNVNLSGCVFAVIEQLLVQSSTAVVGITDDGGLFNTYIACRIRECEVGIDFTNADGWRMIGCYVETNNRGTAQTGVRARVTDTGAARRHGAIIGCYFENNTLYSIDAGPGIEVTIDGGRGDGSVDTGTKTRVRAIRLNGGGLVRNFRGNTGTYLESNFGHIIVERSDGVVGAVSRVHFVDLVPPLIGGRALRNDATNSWADTAVAHSLAGTNPPVVTHDASNGYLGLGALKAVFPIGGSGGGFSRVRFDNTTVTVGAGEGYYTAIAFKSDIGGEVIRLRHIGGADGVICYLLTGTETQVAVWSTAPVVIGGSYSVFCELGANLAAPTTVWFGAFAASTSSSIAFTNTSGPALRDGELVAPSVLLGTTRIERFSGSPEGQLARPVGSLVVNIAGGAGTTLYAKQGGGSTNVGWVGLT